MSNIVAKEEYLTANLDGEVKELFLNYVCTYTEFSSISNSDSFVSGFRLGAKISYDTFVANEKECVK